MRDGAPSATARAVAQVRATMHRPVTVEGDGRIGPLTLHAMDLAEPEKVMEDLRAEATNYYDELVARDPGKQKFLDGWLRRASA